MSLALSADIRIASEEAFLGARVRALTVRLAAKDTSTEEHTRRVALLAVEIGEQQIGGGCSAGFVMFCAFGM